MNDVDEYNYDFSGTVRTGAGTGSDSYYDGFIDTESSYSNDGRSKNHTFFYVQELGTNNPHIVRKWYRMLRLQDGVGEQDRKQQNRRADRERWARTFCSKVDMTPYQTEEVVWICDHISFRGFGPWPAEVVILGIMSLVAGRDGRIMEDDPSYQRLMLDMEVTEGSLIGIRNTVRDKVDCI